MNFLTITLLVSFSILIGSCASLMEEVVVQTVEHNFTGEYEDRFWKGKVNDSQLLKGGPQSLRQCAYDKTDQMWIGNWAKDSFSSWSLENKSELNAYRKLPLTRKEFAYGARFDQADNQMTKITRYGMWPPKENFFQIVNTCSQ